LKMVASGWVSSLQNAKFYTAVPSAFGPNSAAQFRWIPCDPSFTFPSWPTATMYHDKLQALLAKGDTCMLLQAYPFIDEQKTPIEDARVNWASKGGSQWYTVATMTIPQQALDIDMKYCSALAFNPWNTIADHIPLGGVSRIRKSIYAQVQYKRVEIQTGHLFVKDVTFADVLAHKASHPTATPQSMATHPHTAQVDDAIDAGEFQGMESHEEMHHESHHEGHKHHRPSVHVSVDVDVE